MGIELEVGEESLEPMRTVRREFECTGTLKDNANECTASVKTRRDAADAIWTKIEPGMGQMLLGLVRTVSSELERA